MNEATEMIKKKKKEIIRKMKKEKSRNHEFQHIKKHAGIGVNGILKRILVKDEEG